MRWNFRRAEGKLGPQLIWESEQSVDVNVLCITRESKGIDNIIHFYLRINLVTKPKFYPDLKEALAKMVTVYEELKEPVSGVIFFPLTITSDFVTFQNIFALLEGKMESFPNVNDALKDFLTGMRGSILTTYARHAKAEPKRAQANHENNMSASMISIYRSETKLRELFNFPAPDYSEIHSYEIAPLEDYLEDQPPPDYAAFERQYQKEENELIADLLANLTVLHLQSEANGFICKLGTSYRLTPFAISLLRKYNDKEVGSQYFDCKLVSKRQVRSMQDQARDAFDVMVAYRALQLGGSYCHNQLLTMTHIKGYGIRNMVALLWKACSVSYKNNLEFKCQIESMSLLTKALARGVANGARSNNRNNKSSADDNVAFYDDFAVIDKDDCGQGKMNFLFESMYPLIPGIEIDFSPINSFLGKMAEQLLHRLVMSSKDLAQAQKVLAIWIGKSANVDDTDYVAFRNQIISKFCAFYGGFVQEYSSGDPILREKLKNELSAEIHKATSLGGHFMDLIPLPNAEERLNILWAKAHSGDVVTPDASSTAKKSRQADRLLI